MLKMLKQDWDDYFDIQEVFEEEAEPAAGGLRKAADEALVECVNALGYVNPGRMAEVSGLTVKELAEALEGEVFQDPNEYDRTRAEEEGWLLRDQYLTGNLRMKLEEARRLNKKYGGRFEANIRVLEEVMPARVKFQDIGIAIGSPWVPASYYASFAKDVLDLILKPEISYSSNLGLWKVTAPEFARHSIQNMVTYGSKRMPALKILEHTLNASPVKIYDEVDRPERKSGKAQVLNKNETLQAQEKQQALQQAFQSWLVKDPSRIRRLENIYYDTYACVVPGRYHGGFLILPDLNPEVQLYPHQKNAVARIILEKDVLLNHTVGSGKTYAIIAGIHERKRMHLSEKNLIVVPNAVLEAFERAHQQLYPQDPILVVHPQDFTPSKRGKTLERMRDEDFTAIYMPFSSFERISMSRNYRIESMIEEIRQLKMQADQSTETWERNRLRTMAKQMSEQLEELRQELPADTDLPFDALGITTLAVDEAHNYKNISLTTHAEGVVGLHARGSKKCDDLMDKVQYVREHGTGVIFSTGTPLTNSIADLFVLQSYLQPEQLELLHLSHFQEWISSFATRRTSFEIDVDSRSYRMMTRFSRFFNLPELTALFASVCDFYNGDNSRIGLPACGSYIDTVVERTPEQEAYIDELVLRTELIRQKLVRMDEDNLLKVTHDGRLAALDIRLAEPKKRPDPKKTKVYACARNILDCYRNYPGTAQVVFSDQGTPKQGFNLYEELKHCLVTLGIPEQEIAFIHDAETDAKRRKLFAKINRAEVRVVIGSTAKLGTGVNIQEKLIALHHLDIPWKSADIIQREGRLVRQGNTNEEVFRYRYITAGTFDSYSWQILENKQRFISAFMGNALADRSAGDIDDAVLTYAEIKALSVGDPLLKTRIETANELERLKIQANQRNQELAKLRNLVQESPAMETRIGLKIDRLMQDLDCFEANREKMSRAERADFGAELLAAMHGNFGRTRERLYSDLHGFRILFPAEMRAEKPYVVLTGASGDRYEVDLTGAKISGCMQRLEHPLLHLKDRIEDAKGQLAREKKQVRLAKKELAKGNLYEAEAARIGEKLMDLDEELNRRAENGAA